MASSSVSQDDHDVEHEFAIASRKAKVRSARANRAVNTGMTCRGLGIDSKYLTKTTFRFNWVIIVGCLCFIGEEIERDLEGGETHPHIPKYDQTSVVLVEQNDASPKPLIRGLNKEKRSVPRFVQINRKNILTLCEKNIIWLSTFDSRGGHAGKSNKGVRDRRKLREKRRSTAIGVMHLPSTEVFYTTFWYWFRSFVW